MSMLFIILMYCQTFSSCEVCTYQLKNDKSNNVIEDIGEDWRIDSCGCMGLRSIAMAKSMIEESDLVNHSIEEFEKVFGKPNERRTDVDQVVLIYYFNSICDNDNRPRKGADKCWLEFVFKNNQLQEIPKYYSVE